MCRRLSPRRGSRPAGEERTEPCSVTRSRLGQGSLLVFPNQSAVALAASRGRGIAMADSPVAAYIVVQSKGKLKLTGTPYNVAP